MLPGSVLSSVNIPGGHWTLERPNRRSHAGAWERARRRDETGQMTETQLSSFLGIFYVTQPAPIVAPGDGVVPEIGQGVWRCPV